MNSDENSDDGDGNDDDDENVDVASIADNDEHEAAAGVHRPRHRPFLFPQHPQVHGGCHNFSSSLGLEIRYYTHKILKSLSKKRHLANAGDAHPEQRDQCGRSKSDKERPNFHILVG